MLQRVRWPEFWFLYGRVFRQMGQPILWAPLLLQGLIALAVAVVHYYIFSPLTGPIMSGWVRLIRPDYAPLFYHYPAHFVFLPYFFGNARVIVNLLTEALLSAVMIDMLIAVYRGERPALMISFSHAWRRYLSLTLVWAVVIAVLYLVNAYFLDFVQNVLGYSLQTAPRRQFAASLLLRVLTVLIYAPAIYLLPSIMVGGRPFWGLIRRGLAVFARHPFVAAGLVMVPYLIGLPPSWASVESEKIVASFYPELVYHLVIISVVVDVFVNFILLGTSVKFFLDQSD